MNLYDLHSNPETLMGYEQRFEVPSIAYEKAKVLYDRYHKWSPNLEHAIAKDPQYAFYYAREILHKRFPQGEPTIAKSPQWAYNYAVEVIEHKWPEGEKAIASEEAWKQLYMRWLRGQILKGRV